MGGATEYLAFGTDIIRKYFGNQYPDYGTQGNSKKCNEGHQAYQHIIAGDNFQIKPSCHQSQRNGHSY